MPDLYFQNRRGESGRGADREARILRDRAESLGRAMDRAARRPANGAARQLVKVIDLGHIPTEPDHFFAANPCDADGAEREGGTPSFDCDQDTTLFVDFLNKAPKAGDMAVAAAVGGRWVAELGGSQTGCGFTVCAISCSDLDILSGATVQAKRDGAVIASGTTTGAGCVMLLLPEAGTYELVVSKEGYSTFDSSVAMTCGGNKTVKLKTDGNFSACWNVTGCCTGPIPGATITIGGVTLTTDEHGNACWGTAVGGTYPYTIAGPCDRLASQSGTLTFTDCASERNFSVHLLPTDGFHCGVAGDPCPLPGTLSLTDSVYGGCTLTWDGGGWSGSASANFPGCDTPGGVGCPPNSMTIFYSLSACVGSLSVGYTACNYGECIGGTFNPDSAGCPCATSDNCAGKADGAMIFDHLDEVGPVTFAVNGINTLSGTLVVNSVEPFDATLSMTPLSSPCGVAGNSSIYPGGVVFSISE